MVGKATLYQDIDEERFAWFANVSKEEEESRSSAVSIEAGPYRRGDLQVSDEGFKEILSGSRKWMFRRTMTMMGTSRLMCISERD
jgi:hypothetical protein